MDRVQLSVLRFWEHGVSEKEICRRLKISNTKVTKILVTLGVKETDELALQRQGLSIPEIAERLEKSERAVSGRLPYTKGMYKAEYPTINALRVRESKRRKKEREQKNEKNNSRLL